MKGKKSVDKSLNSTSTGLAGLVSGRKGTATTKDTSSRRRSPHPPTTGSSGAGNISDSLNTPASAGPEGTSGTGGTSQSRSTRTNRTLIQRISLDDFMASDDEWIATYASSDDERKKAKRRQHQGWYCYRVLVLSLLLELGSTIAGLNKSKSQQM